MIKINDTIVLNYLNHMDLSEHKNDWFFHASSICAGGKNIFTIPSDNAGLRESVQLIYDSLKTLVIHFTPLNQPVWDILFPYWREVEYSVDLIVGFPKPYDAVTDTAPDGSKHIILDLVRWANYNLSKDSLVDTARNLLTHEMTHVLISQKYPRISEISTGDDYVLSLDKILFDEGFAHLLSYNAMEIDRVEWKSEDLEKVYNSGKTALKNALCETNPVKQQAFLEMASSGSYYEKFACMCGMLYLAKKWMEDGIQGLYDEMELGYELMHRRILAQTAKILPVICED